MFLSIIIVNYNTKNLLRKCLESIVNNLGENNLEIIVVDNNSKDGSSEMIKSNFPEIKLIINNVNMGFGSANNQGTKIAQGDYLLFLNSDTIIIDGFFEKLLEEIEELKNAGVIGFKILNSDGTLQKYCGNFPNWLNLFIESIHLDRLFKGSSKLFYRILDKNFYEKQRNVDWVSGSCFLVKKSVFERINGFDEKYFLYTEDVDLCYQIKKLGYQNIYLPIQAVTHQNQGSSLGKKPAIVLAHQNMIYFFKKNYSAGLATVLKVLFILKSIIYSLSGFVFSLISRKHWDLTKSYFFLLITLFSQKKFREYENSLKQQG